MLKIRHLPPPDRRNSAESTWRRIADAACITVVAWLLSLILTQPFSFSAGSMLSSADRRDFNMTDFYNVVANSRPVSMQDTSIVIVDIAFTDRNDVVSILELIADCNPRAVGLDVTFNEPRAGDERLLEAIDSCPNLVMAVGVSPATGRGSSEFLPDDYSWFYNIDCGTHDHGVINFPTKFDGATIRSFRPVFPVSNGDTLPSLALALARIADPAAAARAEARANEQETIDFPSRVFETIPWYELPDRTELIDGKIVLIGAIGELGDTHGTPTDNRMAGVVIHAHALSTILRGSYYTELSRGWTAVISFLLCFLLCLSNVGMKSHGARALWMRLVQLSGLYIITRVGYWLFVDHRIIIDFSYTLLMLLFGFFAIDIWFGLRYYAEKLKKRFTKPQTP